MEVATKTIAVASTNPVKVQATLHGFERMFPGLSFEVKTVSVPSGVSDQPASDRETLQGALNRANNAAIKIPDAHYWVGIEGGVAEHQGEMAAFAWVVIQSNGMVGKSRTGMFFLPNQIASLIRQGKELGEADDVVFSLSNSKQANGAIGILTGDVIDRQQLYQHAIILALVPFKNKKLYS